MPSASCSGAVEPVSPAAVTMTRSAGMPPRISASRTASARAVDSVVLNVSVPRTSAYAFETYHGALHRLDQRGELREPFLGRAAEAAFLRAEEHLDRQRLLEVAAVRDALAEQLGVLLGDGALARGEQRLERAGVHARLRGALVGLAPSATLVVETVADPAAERGAEHEADRAARERADRGAAAEADRLFLGRRARSRFRGTILRPREARRREQAADQRNDDFLSHEFLSAWFAPQAQRGWTRALLQRTALTRG